MSESIDDGLDGIKEQFEDLCLTLNMDKKTEEMAWKKLRDFFQSSSMEGNAHEWFCCALYSACCETYTPTVGRPNDVVRGNCVPLNQLLRCCNMSIYQFLSRIKNWCEMTKLPSSFQKQIQKLEDNIKITLIIFKEYNKIFLQLFQPPLNEKKNTKYRSAEKCSSNKLFAMCWCLYLCANKDMAESMDFVTSFHLLICCIDLVYLNVLAENRWDLINKQFEGVPKKWGTKEFDVATVATYCIIEPLCRLTTAIPVDTKAMKDNEWCGIIKKFFQTKTIFGNEETLLGIASNMNFDRNLKSLNNSYEQYVLSVGEFDERILLNNAIYRIDSFESARMEQQQVFQSLNPATPLTGKNYLPTKEGATEPVAVATNNVRKLQTIAHISGPTEFIRQAGEDVLKKINDKLCFMSKEFERNFPNKADAKHRYQLSTSIYYYLLEKITQVEINTKPNIDLKDLLNTDSFNTTLIACCVEIVLNAYNYQLKFPWILTCFSITAFNFAKIIEIVVRRHDDILTRDIIKHLNFIEETCLESLAWKNSSQLWEIIKGISYPLPTWSEVDVRNISTRPEPQLQSPVNSAYDTFSSATTSESARRYLFKNANVCPGDAKVVDIKKNRIDANRRAGALPIFLRKFYKLAWLRIKDLCVRLDMSNEVYLTKIWTLFEYSITKRTELMRDRHLDQILMCAIYVYIKVGEVCGKQFTDIMRLYRNQPQATSSIYREVLTEQPNEKKHADIITFYNSTYVPSMTEYALNFSEKKKTLTDLQLSPHPSEKLNIPRQISIKHALFVSQLDKNDVVQSPNSLTYDFGKSPAKDLQKFNEVVRKGKRPLPFDDDGTLTESKIPHCYNTIIGMMNDRQQEGN